MARPKNLKLKKEILYAAWSSFRKNGYEATSYTLLADECGISRNLVQYHYPKKEQFVQILLEELLEQSHMELGLTHEDLDDNFSNLYNVSCCYFDFLLQESSYPRLMGDLLRNRELARAVITFNADWILGHMTSASDAMKARNMHDVILAVGGFYELLYRSIRANRSFDTAAELRTLLKPYMIIAGFSEMEIERNAPQMHLDRTKVSIAVHRINQKLLP